MQWFRANLIQSPERGRIDCLDDHVIGVLDGVVTDLLAPTDPGHAAHAPHAEDLRDGVLLPGFVDLHIHAPQFPQLGQALDVPLEVWLHKYTFPLEARYADIAFATRVYDALVRTLLANGTTTAVYFATLHHAASLKLAQTCLDLGQRALVGRVAQDLPGACPDYYRDPDPQTAIDGTARFVDAVRTLPGNGGLVLPAITPRFIPACSDTALRGLGDLAQETGAHVQTHCSESDWEHSHVLDRCGKSDARALDEFGLLTRKTVLAHSCFLSDSDMNLLRRRGAGVAHCPLSNAFFAGAAFPLRRALEKSVHVGLATDISGGPSASLFDNARAAVTTSRMLEDGTDPARAPGQRGRSRSRIDFRDAFWLATMGGAQVLDLPVGLIEPGRAFDAMLIRSQHHTDIAGKDLLQKIIMLTGQSDIRTTWVAGRKVHNVP